MQCHDGTPTWLKKCPVQTLVVWLQALQEARSRSQAATAEVQRINKEVKHLEVGIPKLQLEAAAARHQSTDLQQRLTQLSQAAKVRCLLVITGQRSCHNDVTVHCLALLSCCCGDTVHAIVVLWYNVDSPKAAYQQRLHGGCGYNK